MVVGFDSLPTNMQNDVKDLRLQSIKQIDVTNVKGGVELAVAGTDKRGFGFLKIFKFFKEND